MAKPKTLAFENRAWEKAEHPRYVSETLKTSETEDEFTCKVARTLEEAKELVETGFEYITDMNDAKLFRKRK